MVRLTIGGSKKSYAIHRLVAEVFLQNPKKLPIVNHKDGNKLNNKADNLEWCSNKENTQHGYDNGLYKFKTRSYPINVYLKDSGEFIAQYKSIRSMCKELKLNRKTVSNILNGTKATNNYMYLFEYVEESQTTIESIA